jgi:hypothetical protein
VIFNQKDIERAAVAIVELCARRLDAKAAQHFELARVQGLGGRNDLAGELYRTAQTHTETAGELRKLLADPTALLAKAVEVHNNPSGVRIETLPANLAELANAPGRPKLIK